MKKSFLVLIAGIFVLTSCEKKEDDKVNLAQKCLNEAKNPSDAAGCAAIIDGIYSEKANRIRCSLTVLENGVTQDRIINAFIAMDGSTHDPVVEVATGLGLGDLNGDTAVGPEELDIADHIKATCNMTNSKGMKTIAQLIWFGTQAQKVTSDLGGDFTNPSDIEGNVCDMDDAEVGEFANDVFNLYCVPTYSNEDICTTLANAGAGADDAANVGEALKEELHKGACPP